MLKTYEAVVWKVLLSSLIVVALWFTGNALYQSYNYGILNTQVPAVISQWSVKEINDDRFLLQADYQFLAEGKLIPGRSALESPYFRNPGAAKDMIPRYAEKSWQVWYQASNPLRSALEKSFPFKEVISALLIWGIFVYFYWFRFHYIVRFFNNDEHHNSQK